MAEETTREYALRKGWHIELWSPEMEAKRLEDKKLIDEFYKELEECIKV